MREGSTESRATADAPFWGDAVSTLYEDPRGVERNEPSQQRWCGF